MVFPTRTGIDLTLLFEPYNRDASPTPIGINLIGKPSDTEEPFKRTQNSETASKRERGAERRNSDDRGQYGVTP